MTRNAIKLREDLRALAATILQIVQYEITEAKVVEVLRENRRLVTMLEIELNKDLSTKVKEEFSKAMEQRMGEELDEYINQRVTYLDPLTITKEEDKKLIEQLDERAKERAKEIKPITLSEQDKKLLEAQAYTTEQIAKMLKVPESYIIHSGPSPARQAMGEIVKDHLMPPAPFINRGKADD